MKGRTIAQSLYGGRDFPTQPLSMENIPFGGGYSLIYVIIKQSIQGGGEPRGIPPHISEPILKGDVFLV